ncbi:MAG TPA: tetratricopeptide repeat protein, partial [Myxococcales bacterium]|nr:tetratricopeptide repeat protein [Myxococcales bacterium]
DRLAASARVELIYVLSDLQSRFSAVEPAIREARAALDRFGSDPELESRLATYIARSLIAQDRCEEALPHLQSALKFADRAYGRNDPRRAQILTELGDGLGCVGQLDNAREELAQARVLSERTFGPNHPEVARALNARGKLLFLQRDYQGALDVHRRALEIHEQVLGPSSIFTGLLLVNVGVDLISMNKNREGRDQVKKGLAVYERELGMDNPRLAHPLLVLGHVEVELGNPEEAVRACDRALTLLQGREETQTAMARFNLAMALRAAKRDEKRAQDLARQARAYFEKRKDAQRYELEVVDSFLEEGRPRKNRPDTPSDIVQTPGGL